MLMHIFYSPYNTFIHIIIYLSTWQFIKFKITLWRHCSLLHCSLCSSFFLRLPHLFDFPIGNADDRNTVYEIWICEIVSQQSESNVSTSNIHWHKIELENERGAKGKDDEEESSFILNHDKYTENCLHICCVRWIQLNNLNNSLESERDIASMARWYEMVYIENNNNSRNGNAILSRTNFHASNKHVFSASRDSEWTRRRGMENIFSQSYFQVTFMRKFCKRFWHRCDTMSWRYMNTHHYGYHPE